MRAVIVSLIIFFTVIADCEARSIFPKSYMRNVNKAIYNTCNKQAYSITNNSDMYNCLSVNNSENCRYIKNFTEYNEVRTICVKKYNGDIGTGVLISILCWFFLILMCQQ